MADQLQEFAQTVLDRGPDRVLVDGSGSAVSPTRARAEYGVRPDLILIRADGWSLGAPVHLAKQAEALWPDEWIGFLKRPSRTPKPYKK